MNLFIGAKTNRRYQLHIWRLACPLLTFEKVRIFRRLHDSDYYVRPWYIQMTIFGHAVFIYKNQKV
jgi:hypothetical protein